MQKSCIQGPPNAKWKWNDGTNNRQGCLRLSGIHQLCNVEKISAPAFQSGTKQQVNVSWSQLEYKAEPEWLQYRAITVLHQKCQKSSGQKFHQVGCITPCPYYCRQNDMNCSLLEKPRFLYLSQLGHPMGSGPGWVLTLSSLVKSVKVGGWPKFCRSEAFGWLAHETIFNDHCRPTECLREIKFGPPTKRNILYQTG